MYNVKVDLLLELSIQFGNLVFVRGYHEYQYEWQPTVREVLVLKRRTTIKDSLAVCIEEKGQVVSCVPRNLALLIFFLLKDVNKGAGMGMRVPCIYHLFGPMKRLKEVIKFHFCETEGELTDKDIIFISEFNINPLI